MLSRYSFAPIDELWSFERKLAVFIDIEAAVNNELQIQGVIPTNLLGPMLYSINMPKLIKLTKKLEQQTHHDVNAFVFAAEKLCGSDGRWIHYGLTSNDLNDTYSAIAINESLSIIANEMRRLECGLIRLKDQYTASPVKILGRTHGQHAEELELWRVFAGWVELIDRCIEHLYAFKMPGKLSGALGDNKHVSKEVEDECLRKLGLNSAPATTQIVSRFYHADLISRLVLCAGSLEQIALQIRLYQQSEIDEMREPFGKAQTGSSAMPHKHNSILSENLCGLARVMRGYLVPAFEDQATWHQRDLCQSSVERIIIPDALSLLGFMTKRMHGLVSGLIINESKIRDNVNRSKSNLKSQDQLLKEVRIGKSRAKAYRAIQDIK